MIKMIKKTISLAMKMIKMISFMIRKKTSESWSLLAPFPCQDW